MKFIIKTNVHTYKDDIKKQFFLSNKDKAEIDGKIVNIIVSLDRVTTMRTLVNIINYIQELATFSDEQKINLNINDSNNSTDCVDIEITA